ncbi:MAG: catalase family protein, partial [Nannocystaceae bacterium]|nr:catalase family protein [Nannocystaceae bacterium]
MTRLVVGVALALGLGVSACKTKQEPAEPNPWPENMKSGQEWVPPGEGKDIATTEALLLEFVQKGYQETGTAHRDAHVKPHGCLTASVSIPDDLPPELAVGVFSEPESFDAWIRFSNSSDKFQRDRIPDGRGMALKMMNVPGTKALPGHEDETSQDIILINYPQFVVKNAADYVEFTKDTTIGHPLRFFFHEGKSYRPQLSSAEKLATQRVVSPRQPAYFSMTPYLFGDGMAVKYGAKPCEADTRRRRALGKNYLRTQLVEDMAADGACFELQVQLQLDPNQMPIEDPTVAWPTSVSPYRTVATIDIPAQTFNTDARRQMCEFMSFNPWQTRTEHRPLGGINRVRKSVYVAISLLRHGLDGKRSLEPTSHNVQAYLAAI